MAVPIAARVLVVDDEPAVRDSLTRTLRFEGYEVAEAADGVDALAVVQSGHPDLLVLDVMMPRMDGLETCRRLRSAQVYVPVLMLTARDSVGDRVSGLDAGADDYLVKPFALQELLARVRALLRRSQLATPAGEPDPAALTFADLSLNPSTREVHRGGRPIELTRTEFSMLEAFLRNPRLVLTRTQLFELVWGYDFGPGSNSLDVYVGYLRRKLEAENEPRLIHTIRGVGYALREPG
ncbi:MAG: transcriptional regulator [Actinomycetia bacterium]|nr:transcriptional regulator [Actinomycetes bacterium]MDQ1657215.1 two-component system, OmpR family, response regulator MprA [Cryptosporangiaceae bacterium]